MKEKANEIWIANHPFLDRALFLRQRIHRILLTSRVKALLNLVGASFWISETDYKGQTPGQGERIPERYSEVVLYHVRTGRLIEREEILGFQGIEQGDVLVLFRGDRELLDIQGEMIRQSPGFPVSLSGVLSEEITLLSWGELMEMVRRGPPTGADPGSGQRIEVVSQGDTEEGTDQGGRVASKGPRGSKETFQEIWEELEPAVDPEQLARELSELRRALGEEAADSGAEGVLRRVGLSEIAARAGDGGKTLEILDACGIGLLDVAVGIGAGMAAAAMRAVAGPDEQGRAACRVRSKDPPSFTSGDSA
jgi:hypothetical protein